jgi:hypothetical protein
MRPRFSIRWLMVLVAVCAGLLYWLFVLPTNIANHFADKVNNGYLFDPMMTNNWHGPICWVKNVGPPGFELHATLEPRTWQDVLACQRRILVEGLYTSATTSQPGAMEPFPMYKRLLFATPTHVDPGHEILPIARLAPASM